MRRKLIALAGTVLNMKFSQLSRTLFRKTESHVISRIPLHQTNRYDPDGFTTKGEFGAIGATKKIAQSTLDDRYRSFLNEHLTLLDKGVISFMNRGVRVDDQFPDEISPNAGEKEGYPRLWTIKLLSMEPVVWLSLTPSKDDSHRINATHEWLTNWDQSSISTIPSPNYRRRYWASYTVSRRIGNLAMLGDLLEAIETSNHQIEWRIEKNLRFLSHHIEHDVGGNHLFENAYALIIGGAILHDDDWIQMGINILRRELSSQLLEDGMHFQKSPMYHTILLYRGAWSLNVLKQAGYSIPVDIIQRLKSMYSFLLRTAPGEADYPLLNDSVYHECPSRSSCLAFCEHVFGFERGSPKPTDMSGASGYFRVQSGGLYAIVDGGTPGPDHLPGHSHNDVGSIVAWVGDEPILRDSGAFDYQPGCRRMYSRSVAAHNTVQADDVDQTIIDGRYKMGPRPRPNSWLEEGGAVKVLFESPRFVTDYTHERTVEPSESGFRIVDRMTGSPDTFTCRYHITEESSVELDGNGVRLETPTGEVVRMDVMGADEITLIDTEFYPEYGVAINRPCVEILVTNQSNQNNSITCLLQHSK